MRQIRLKFKGTALAYGLIIMTVVLIILTSVLSYVSSQIKFSQSRVEREKAFQIAEAGIYYYRWYLAHATDGMNAEQLQDFWQNPATKGVSEDEAGFLENYEDSQGGGIIGQYHIVLEPPDIYSTIATVTSTGWTNKMPGLTRTVKARFRRPSWSEYAILVDEFVRLGEGTEVFGKIHSNEGVRFDGLAHNSVTSLLPRYNDPDHSGDDEFGVHTHVNIPPATGVNDNFRPLESPGSIIPYNPVPSRADVFEGGRQFPVPRVSFSGVQTDLNYMKKIACNDTGSGCTVSNGCWSSGCYFDSSNLGRQIILRADDTFDICRVDSMDSSTNSMIGFRGVRTNGSYCTAPNTTNGPNTQCRDKTTSPRCYCVCDNFSIPNDGIIYVDDNVWLEGLITSGEKRITVVAGLGKMFLGNNDILYSDYSGDNTLGIIGQSDVEIIRNSQDDLQIDGALIAQTGRVGRSNYGTSDHKTTITVNGAIATKKRYGFAWTNGTSDWGYTNRNLNFDNNLLYFPPPYFPTGTEYSIDLWEEL
jgi:hypothetical protein